MLHIIKNIEHNVIFKYVILKIYNKMIKEI